MKTFLAIYTGTAAKLDEWKRLEGDVRAERERRGIDAWMAWGTEHAAAIVDMGAPLGTTKRIAADGITDIRNNVAGYVVVRADSHEAAARMFVNHPHFTILPGDGVEIMECLPLPDRSD